MDILSRKAPDADHRIQYGAGKEQFGELWLPSRAHAPLVVFVHGGWWKAAYDLGYGGFLCAALRAAGVAVWSIEYRRLGEAGGGWPATFQDVAAGYDFVGQLGEVYGVDLDRVVAAGHSAGGHLAFWLAGRHHIAAGSPIREPEPRIPMRGVVGLAGAVDLGLTIELSGQSTFAHDRREVYGLMGGTPDEEPERYLAGDPGHLLPFNIPQVLLQGTEDDQIPGELPRRWAEKARRLGDTVVVTLIPRVDHFAVVDPESKAWPLVQAAILHLLGA